MTDNAAVADLLETFADLLEAKGVDYKPRAYRRAAESVRDHPEPVADLAAEGTEAVAGIENVGEAISAKIVEYVETGAVGELEDLREELPVEMSALTRVEGVGPKTAGQLYEALGIRTLADLEAAAQAGEIREVQGFGQKTEENIREGVEFARQAHERVTTQRGPSPRRGRAGVSRGPRDGRRVRTRGVDPPVASDGRRRGRAGGEHRPGGDR